MKRFKTNPHTLRRILAGMLDYTIIYIINLCLIIYLGTPNEDGDFTLTGVSLFIPILIWFLITVGIETSLGATLGNKLVNLKPIPRKESERKLTLGELLKRHLLDPIDMCFFGLVGILTINNSDYNQRVGDIWADTIVVKNY